MAKQKQQPTSENQIARDWLAITIRQLRGNIREVKAVDTAELLSSFKSTIGAGPRIRLEYSRHGMYIDMGVGRGMPIGGARELGDKFGKYRDDRGRLHRHVRKPKKWFSKEISHQTKRLAEIVSDYKGEVVIGEISRSLPANLTINI